MNAGYHVGFLAIALIALAGASIPLSRHPRGPALFYAIAAVVAAIAMCSAAIAIARGVPLLVQLPLGLPSTGLRLRLDALSGVFSVIVNLGAALASLYAVGYGRHEPEQGRVLPFYCLFVLGMNFVVLADDAFAFLLGWEFMSLSSWALVLSQHRDEENRRAALLSLPRAALGTLALLSAYGLRAGGAGGYGFEEIRTL
jgi:formate hydrogenlyase subunit 3/multisubunit Na+/H+ antiporter MnhD subunit